MAFLVRKLGKMDEIFSLLDKTDVQKVYADIPTMEFRSKNGPYQLGISIHLMRLEMQYLQLLLHLRISQKWIL